MKNKIGIFLLTLFLFGCLATPDHLMKPVEYKKPISIHSQKNLQIYWRRKDELAFAPGPYISNNSDPLAAIITASIVNMDRENNPSRYTFAYGKAQEAVFLTSFKDTLQRNRVFNKISFVSQPEAISANEARMTIYFKEVKVHDYQITLDVEMTIESNNKPIFKRTYLVHNSEDNSFGKDFQAKQQEVSYLLLEKLIRGLEQWHSENISS